MINLSLILMHINIQKNFDERTNAIAVKRAFLNKKKVNVFKFYNNIFLNLKKN